MLWFGPIMLIIGVLLVRWVGKRKFNRRNASGLEEFESYDASIVTRAGERIVNVIAGLCIGTGVIFTALTIISSL